MDIDSEVESRLGQALVAFGQGSGAVNVPSDTVTKVQAMFRVSFRALLARDPDKFHRLFPHVLDVFRTMGTLAADLASQDGASAVECVYFERAFQITKTYEEKAAGGRTAFC
jgi:hypothetical protein